MDTYKTLRNLLFLGIVLFISNFGFSQDSKVNMAESKLVVYGTSNLHDWDIVAKAMAGKASFDLDNNTLQNIISLDFSVESEQLLSGRSGMDENTFKALNTKKYKTINYKLTKVLKIIKTTANTYSVEAQGDLMIAGTTKNITQNFIVVVNGKKVSFSGKTKITMAQFNITPPTALFGTIKTGPDVSVDFKVTYN
ncbi:YceI family protein [Flavobacterium aciduliphilum]|uniref:YceI-like domain-containing protein n=1 Tax=Flavobacterium aciduliphilum TaxID=1101402 RepID=A0A328YEU5_9FLAO|nr:YceI family protein [Flavobacterium aciduliphilum]RAR72518.1 YceI-like domain-containing protein [Flavobacterium aciduliphilum]